jgi:hypothetical protein
MQKERTPSKVTSAEPYPKWVYYPSENTPPEWVSDMTLRIADVRDVLATTAPLTSDAALGIMRPGLEEMGFEVEDGRSRRLRRPVLFGEQGVPRVTYEVDAYHPESQILLEVEAGRGWMGNAVYRDLVRTSLIVGARFLVIGMLIEYRYKSGGRETVNRSYEEAKNLLDAIYASRRLALPFEGVLLFGY